VTALNLSLESVLTAFALTLFAGLSTGIGSLIAWFAKKTSTRFLSVMLGFSGGVMIYVPMIELFQEAKGLLSGFLGAHEGMWVTVAGFFGGMLVIAVIDKLVPEEDNPHDIKLVESMADGAATGHKKPVLKKRKLSLGASAGKAAPDRLMRLGLLTAIAITVHNFPEGMATLVAALNDKSLGLSIAVAIAIHNIPEGIAVSVPVYTATGDRKKAFKWSLLSGLAEPLGAVVGYFVLLSVMNEVVSGVLIAAIAGIMVFISLDEILPAAREYGEPHLSIYGMVGGMAVMAISLILLS
jgi:ZIP family zinc transporter